MTDDYNYVLGKKYGFPSQVQVLNDVTKLLPDDTWLTQLEVKNVPKGKEPRRELLLRGESANAGRLVSLIEETKTFVDAAPRSPTTKIQPGPGEIFDLGAQLAPTPAPPPVQLASAPIDASPAAAAPNTAPAPAAAAVPPPSTAPAATPSTSPLPIAPAVAPSTAVAAPAEPPHAFGPPPPHRDTPPSPGSVSTPAASAPPPTVVNGQAVNSGAIPGTAPRPVEKAQP
jgi:hypothetical protein